MDVMLLRSCNRVVSVRNLNVWNDREVVEGLVEYCQRRLGHVRGDLVLFSQTPLEILKWCCISRLRLSYQGRAVYMACGFRLLGGVALPDRLL